MPDFRADLEQILYTTDAYSRSFVNNFNQYLSKMTPIEIVIVTIAAMIVLAYLSEKLDAWRKLGFKALVFRFAVKLPFVKG